MLQRTFEAIAEWSGFRRDSYGLQLQIAISGSGQACVGGEARVLSGDQGEGDGMQSSIPRANAGKDWRSPRRLDISIEGHAANGGTLHVLRIAS